VSGHPFVVVEEARQDEKRDASVNELLPSTSNSIHQFRRLSLNGRSQDEPNEARASDQYDGCSNVYPARNQSQKKISIHKAKPLEGVGTIVKFARIPCQQLVTSSEGLLPKVLDKSFCLNSRQTKSPSRRDSEGDLRFLIAASRISVT
jgi:hypothetical protein